jgi:hypothetical protein
MPPRTKTTVNDADPPRRSGRIAALPAAESEQPKPKKAVASKKRPAAETVDATKEAEPSTVKKVHTRSLYPGALLSCSWGAFLILERNTRPNLLQLRMRMRAKEIQHWPR